MFQLPVVITSENHLPTKITPRIFNKMSTVLLPGDILLLYIKGTLVLSTSIIVLSLTTNQGRRQPPQCEDLIWLRRITWGREGSVNSHIKGTIVLLSNLVEKNDMREGRNVRMYSPAAPDASISKGQLCDYVTWLRSVRYHCGGWSEEVNSCILISYMVYL